MCFIRSTPSSDIIVLSGTYVLIDKLINGILITDFVITTCPWTLEIGQDIRR